MILLSKWDIVLQMNVYTKLLNFGLLFATPCYSSFSRVLVYVLNACIHDEIFFKIKQLGLLSPPDLVICCSAILKVSEISVPIYSLS